MPRPSLAVAAVVECHHLILIGDAHMQPCRLRCRFLPIGRLASAIGDHALPVDAHAQEQAIVKEQQQAALGRADEFNLHLDRIGAVADQLRQHGAILRPAAFGPQGQRIVGHARPRGIGGRAGIERPAPAQRLLREIV
jgi:hypothetical protein